MDATWYRGKSVFLIHGDGQFGICLKTGWHALRYEGRGELLKSFATLPTPIANRFGHATRGLVVAATAGCDPFCHVWLLGS